MKRLTEQLKEALSNLARSNAGEMLSAAQKARLLDDMPTPPADAVREGRREVALSVGTLLPPRVVRYAIGVCQRLDADLYVLASDAAAAAIMLDATREERLAAGIDCRIEAVSGSGSIMNFFHAHPQVVFAVAGGHGDPLTALFGSGNRFARRKPPVPIVLVDEGSTANPEVTLPAGLHCATVN